MHCYMQGSMFMPREGSTMTSIIITAVVAIIVGVLLGFVIARYVANAATKRKAEEAESILNDAKREAESIKREAEVEAKDEALKLRAEIESERKERQKDFSTFKRRDC